MAIRHSGLRVYAGLLRELSAGVCRSGLEPGGGSEAVALGHPMMPIGAGQGKKFSLVDDSARRNVQNYSGAVDGKITGPQPDGSALIILAGT